MTAAQRFFVETQHLHLHRGESPESANSAVVVSAADLDALKAVSDAAVRDAEATIESLRLKLEEAKVAIRGLLGFGVEWERANRQLGRISEVEDTKVKIGRAQSFIASVDVFLTPPVDVPNTLGELLAKRPDESFAECRARIQQFRDLGPSSQLIEPNTQRGEPRGSV